MNQTGDLAHMPRHYMGRIRGLRRGGGKKGGATTMASTIGTGARFKNIVGQLSKRPSVNDPKGLAAFTGHKKYGSKTKKKR